MLKLSNENLPRSFWMSIIHILALFLGSGHHVAGFFLTHFQVKFLTKTLFVKNLKNLSVRVCLPFRWCRETFSRSFLLGTVV